MSVPVSDRIVVPAPDPVAVRLSTLEELSQLGMRLPPPNYPLVWDPGDAVSLRRPGELAARSAIIGILLTTRGGLPRRHAMRWLRDARLLERVTPAEWRYIAGGVGDPAVIDLEWDALHGLAWVLGLVDDLDPTLAHSDELPRLLPDPWASGHDYPAWLDNLPPDRCDPDDAAVLLDLYYCLDWSYQQAQQHGESVPGLVPPVAVGARRWALEWAVLLHGPHHGDPPNWDDVDLSV